MSTKYSRLEVERKWLVDALPPLAYHPRRITDRYIVGTRLRLRRIDDPAGSNGIWKLGHKVRVDPASPFAINHTSMYLDDAEAAVFTSLKAHRLVKIRWHVDIGDLTAAVDVFDPPHDGLIMIDVEVRTVEMATSFVAPAWFGREVTNNESFTGFALAQPPDHE